MGLSGHTSAVRAAVIGYGLAGRVFHAPLIAAVDGLTVAAVVTADRDRGVAAASAYPDAAILTSADELFTRGAGLVDVAVVATPNRAHVSLARASLEAGIPVVVDKPLATSAGEIRELIALAERTGTSLTVFQNRRWDSDFLTLRALLADGDLGELRRFESRFERPPRPAPPSERLWRLSGDPDDGGGLLFDLGAHLIDQALVLFGRASGVYAELDRRGAGATVDDDSFVALAFASGVRAHLWMSTTAPSPSARLRASGSAGSYEHPGLDPQETALAAGGRPGDAEWGVAPESEWGWLTTLSADGPVSRTVRPVPGAYERFYAELRDHLRGERGVPVDPRDALATQAVIDAARRSAATGAVVAPDGEDV